MSEFVYELSIIKVDEAAFEQFSHIRKAYIHNVSSLQGFRFAKMYKSFSSFTKKRSKDVYIDLKEWSSLEALKAAHAIGMEDDATIRYFASHEQQLYVRMQLEQKDATDIQRLLEESKVVEFGIRQVKASKKDLFHSRRRAFIKHITKQEGARFNREFVSVDEDLRVILFGWDSREHFTRAGSKVLRSPSIWLAMLRYFPLLKQRAFQVGTPIFSI